MDIRTIHDARRFSSEKMQKISVFASERLFCDVYCLEPGQSQKPHRHEHADKVYLVLEGRGRFQIAGESGEVAPGQAVLAPAGAAHGVENASSDRLVLLVFIAPPPANA